MKKNIKKILAIGAHPDDLEFGCGGTLLSFAEEGAALSLFVMTEGGMGGNSLTRRKEQEAAGSLLRAKIFWGGYQDTTLHLDRHIVGTIESVIRKIQPDLIFTHWMEDSHQDHRITSQATVSATRYAQNLLFYEVPTSINFSPGVFVDIHKRLSGKYKLLRAHRSQVYQTKVPGLSILESARSCAIFRGYQNRVKFAEGFVPFRLTLHL